MGRNGKDRTKRLPPSLRDVLGVARDFYVGAGVLHERIEDALNRQTDNQGVAPGSFVILSTLHLELLMKALLALHRRPAWGHNLLELYVELPREERLALEREYKKDRSDNSAFTIVDALEGYKDAFVNYRYAHDYKPDPLDVVSLKDLIRVVTRRVLAMAPAEDAAILRLGRGQ